MVFYTNWDDSGLGFCMTGYNPLWPCPYMSEENFPNSLRLLDEPLDDKVTVIKEPGPGPINCLLLSTIGLFYMPVWIWRARSMFLEFSKHKDDLIYLIYRCKNACFERNVRLVHVYEAYIDVLEVMEGKKKRKSYTLVVLHDGGMWRWEDMALTNARWRNQLTKIVDAINRLVHCAPC